MHNFDDHQTVAANFASTTGAQGVTRIKLSSPAAVITAVPRMLGFRPEQSAVVIFIGGPRNEVHLTVRVDLPAPSELCAAWVESLAATGRHADSDRAIVVIVDDVEGATAPALPWERLVESLSHELEQHDIALQDALLVGRDHWWSYLCTNARCCPPEGSPIEDSEAWRVAAEFAVEGVSPLPSRAAVADRLRPLDDEWALEVAECVAEIRGAGASMCVDEVLDLLLLSCGPDSVTRHDPEVAAEALVALADIPVRDGVIVGLVSMIASNGTRAMDRTLDGLCALVRSAPDAFTAPVASVTAVIAWQCGDGALASCALDRALEADGFYSLARLIDTMVRNGIPPQAVRGSLAALDVAAKHAG